MRQAVVLNERFVRRVEKDHGAAGVGPVHPLFQLFPGVDSAGRVVRGAQVNQVGIRVFLRGREESVLRSGGQCGDPPAGHDVRVQVGGIRRLHDAGGRFPAEQVQDIAQFIARAAGDKHLRRLQGDAPACVVAGYRFAEEGHAGFRRIALEALRASLVIRRFVQGLHRRVAQRQGHVTDAEPVNRFAGMGFLICLHLLPDPVE